MAYLRRGFFAVAAGALVACGLDESGLMPLDGGSLPDQIVPPNDGGGGDVQLDVQPDVPLPPTCATTDVSCFGLDAGVPDGWAPFRMSPGDAGCPSGDFTGTPWLTNPTLAAGSCACSCAKTADWTCPATVDIANGAACGSASTINVGQCQQQTSMHIELTKPATASGATCASDAAAPAPQADPVTLCAAGCDAGAAAICGAPAGERCIAADGDQACPGSGFTKHLVGASATGSCAACSCSVGAAPDCAPTATVYFGYFNGQNYNANNSCATTGSFTSQDVTPDNTCQSVSAFYNSLLVSLAPPPPASCTPGASSGDAGLSAPKTVCCK